MISRVIDFCRRVVGGKEAQDSTLIPRDEHSISRKDISDNALKVLYRLNKAGYEAYLVGGGVRDLLLGLHPKDFDIVTNARPDDIRKLFRNCRLVGRRFRLAHILFGREIIEVATFRGSLTDNPDAARSDEGMLLRDNAYSDSVEEDALRRDFTINALYYNIADYSILDFAGGLRALKQRRIELIGDPATRYREDPVRMLRAVRFATKLDMSIAPDTAKPIRELAPLLDDIPAARLFEECLKLFMAGHGLDNFRMLCDYGLFQRLFPSLVPFLDDPKARRFIEMALENTDHRVRTDQKSTPAYLFAAFLWPLLDMRAQDILLESGLPTNDAYQIAMNEVLDDQCRRIAIPRRFTTTIREIWTLQTRLDKRAGRRAERLFEHPRFRAAFDFLEMRGEVEGKEIKALAQWWQEYQEQGEPGRRQLVSSLFEAKGPKRRKPRKRRPRKPQAQE
ncbi:polynucleotide adenylyltransferase PcnB [Gallaecimonas xiamenensis]|uniref:polynucleotide adenylyltransferase PcnB n=1 Tax=Gallaecimonas xiamenensis TaxID=1207039 RepID=UPI00178C6C3B|nr:polynucleotide adenylyltransferase PcnB [Gallaecimonas xiamenensis]